MKKTAKMRKISEEAVDERGENNAKENEI